MNRKSYYSKKIKKDYQAKSLANPFYRKKDKKPEKKIFRNFKLTLLILLFGFLFWFFYLSPWFKIEEIEVRGNERISSELVIEELNNYFESNNPLIFNQKNIFIFNKKNSALKIKDEFTLNDIKIKKKIPRKIVVEISERPYAFIYNEKENYYFSSADNYLMAEINFSEESLETPSLIEESGDLSALDLTQTNLEEIEAITESLEASSREDLASSSSFEPVPDIKASEEGTVQNILNEDGLPIVNINKEEKNHYFIIENKNKESLIRSDSKIRLNEDYLAFIFQLNGELSANDFKLDRFIVADQYYNSVFAKIVDGPQIYFNVNNEISGQIGNLILVKNVKIKDNFNRLEYIDLRYGDKIYFYPDNIID